MVKSEKKIKEILLRVDVVKALTFSLIAAIEAKLYEDSDGDEIAIKGSEHILVNNKALLDVFGETLQDHFNRLTATIERELNSEDD